ncbi:MAG: hypothetical protein AAGG51_06305 [Cyanobacteria bacterium P01_G01_bin.54]
MLKTILPWRLILGLLGSGFFCIVAIPAAAQTPIVPEPATSLEIDPAIIENSPRLQDWLKEIPDVRQSIRRDPAFAPRLRVGYAQFPATHKASGWSVGVEDLGISETPMTVSGQYQQDGAGDRITWGADLRYYLKPLGSYINVAPVLGYRHITTEGQQTAGVNVGLKIQLSLSRTGAADLSLQQTFVSPGQSEEVGITTLSAGYAVTPELRLATDIEKQNSPWENDSRVSLLLEWLL